MKYILFSETAFHHEGDEQSIYEMIDQTVEAGFEGIKFQILFDLSKFMSIKHASYEKINSMILTIEQWNEIIQYTLKRDLKLVIMPLDVGVIDWIIKNSIPTEYLEIHSVSFYDMELCQKIKDAKIPVILGTGGRTLEEIEKSVEYFGEQLKILMVGFQSFPTNLERVKLGKIRWLAERFSGLQIGYADHSSYDSKDAIQSLVYAYILGARAFEKHITCQEGVSKTDYESAVGLEKMKNIKMELDRISKILNYEEKDYITLNEQEMTYRNRQKQLVANGNIKKGEIINPLNTTYKVHDFYSENKLVNLIFDKKVVAKIDIFHDEVISDEHIVLVDN